MRKYLFLLGICFIMFVEVVAQPVSIQKAHKAASQFFGGNQKKNVFCSYMSIDKNDTLFYVFNSGNRFVVVSGDERCVPILAYSDQSAFYADEVIPPVQMWLDNYSRQIKFVKQSQNDVKPLTDMWKHVMSSDRKGNEEKGVAPLLTSQWSQTEFFNFFGPRDINSYYNSRCVTGCVATAMAQLLYYFRFPSTGVGSYEYDHEVYGHLSADFANTTYDYDAMVDCPKQINPAIALLNYHCGVAVDMVYGPSASGMVNHKSAYAFREYFKMNKETKYIFRDSLGMAHDSLNMTPYPFNWDSTIVAHLEHHIPLYYAGWSVPWTEGHGFVCDGYKLDADSNYYFHFNFGWGGSDDGYFYTDNLYVGGYNFNIAQELIINAYPDTARYDYPEIRTALIDTLTAAEGSMVVSIPAWKNASSHDTRTWVIMPDTINLNSISLDLSFQLGQGDSVIVVADGIDTLFTAESGVTSYKKVCQGKNVVVKWVSGKEDTVRTFRGTYNAEYEQYCATMIVRTSASGSMSDGSGDHQYNHCAICQGRIITPRANHIDINFNYFKTERDHDILYFYDLNNDSLLLYLSGNDLKRMNYTFWTNRLYVLFETDEKNSDEGWEFTYSASTGIEEPIMNHFEIYPNPTAGKITMKMSGQIADQPVLVYDLQGRLLKSMVTTGDEVQTISISDLTNGLYILKVANETYKIIKQ